MIKSNQFRKELQKIMPGYKWTVHKSTIYGMDLNKKPTYITATGIQTSGFNRMSTLEVTVREKNGAIEYESTSAGFGKNAEFLARYTGSTLAQSLRGLQEHYEVQGNNYMRHAADLEGARAKKL